MQGTKDFRLWWPKPGPKDGPGEEIHVLKFEPVMLGRKEGRGPQRGEEEIIRTNR